jgi:hypothetical protein
MIKTEKVILMESNTHIQYEWYLLPENYKPCASHPQKSVSSNRWVNDEGNHITDLHCSKCNMTAFIEMTNK